VPSSIACRTIYILISKIGKNTRIKMFLPIPSFLNNEISQANEQWLTIHLFVEFDPGSGLTLAACFTHASRTEVKCSIKRSTYQ